MSVKSKWQDRIFFFGSLVLALALLPTLFGDLKPELTTSIMTSSVLTVFTINYFTMKFWWSSFMTGITAICWIILAIQVV